MATTRIRLALAKRQFTGKFPYQGSLNSYYQCCYSKNGADKLMQAIKHDGSLPHPLLDSSEHCVYGGTPSIRRVYEMWGLLDSAIENFCPGKRNSSKFLVLNIPI